MSVFLSDHIIDILVESPSKDNVIPTVYCDLDGVLADFYTGVEKYINVSRNQLENFLSKQNGWKTIEKKEPHLFAKLPLLPDAKGLMRGLTSWRDMGKINLFVLTAIPNEWYRSPMRNIATQDKIMWVTRHFPQIPAKNVFVVRRENKQDYAARHAIGGDSSPVLIDDFGKNIREWEQVGGLGIKHTSSTSSLQALYTYLE